jgi:hypothetical protein
VYDASRLPNATLAKLIDYICCWACSGTSFYTTISGGYQADCATRTLKKITPDKCNKKKSELALLNCWKGAISGAWMPAANLGVVVLASCFVLLC